MLCAGVRDYVDAKGAVIGEVGIGEWGDLEAMLDHSAKQGAPNVSPTASMHAMRRCEQSWWAPRAL